MLILSLPAVYSFELTSACNNRCPGCYNTFADQRSGRALPASSWMGLLEQIGPQAARIRLTGGEPTLHAEFAQILQAACGYEAEVTLFTNARWQHPQKILDCLQGAKHLAGLLVSMHGARAETHEAFTRVPGSFNETLANIQRARQRGIPVAFSTVIAHSNFHELEAIVALGEQLGIEYVAFNRDLGPLCTGGPHTKTALLAAVRRIEAMARLGKKISYGACIPQCLRTNSSDGCMAGITQAVIDPWGNLRPCVYAQNSVGNVFETQLSALWHSSEMEAWRSDGLLACLDCAAYPVCHGGCPAARQRFQPSDPLQGQPRQRFTVYRTIRPLPERGRPVHQLRIRTEDFGYSLIGKGQIWPISAAGLEIVDASSGETTLAELRARFDEAQIEFLQELWNAGLIELIDQE